MGGEEAEGGGDLREVAAELQLAAARPVEAVKGSLHQRRHDAAQAGLIRAAVRLTVVLHAEPGGGGAERAVLSHTQRAHPGKMSRWAGDSALTKLQTVPFDLSFPTVQWGRPPHWMEAEAAHCPSMGLSSFCPPAPSSNPP